MSSNEEEETYKNIIAQAVRGQEGHLIVEGLEKALSFEELENIARIINIISENKKSTTALIDKNNQTSEKPLAEEHVQ